MLTYLSKLGKGAITLRILVNLLTLTIATILFVKVILFLSVIKYSNQYTS
jgi:hypothetical protein